MATPTWDQLIYPVLELACKEPVSRHSAREHVFKTVSMTQEEREERLKSGSLKVGNRVGWAMSHLVKAKFIEKVAKATYSATDAGKQFFQTHKDTGISRQDLRAVDGYKEAWKDASESRKSSGAKSTTAPKGDDASTPDESIEAAYNELNASLSDELLETMHEMNPYKFEQLVVDLLFAMGYGGSREEAATVTQKSNDGGIDGIINEDRLGLDVIYIQAKRYQSTIGRKEIQSFVGAIAGKQANKGVFITTSDFKKTATEYAQSVPQKIILISGSRLADLMIEHNIGVSTVRTVELKRIDSDYFED